MKKEDVERHNRLQAKYNLAQPAFEASSDALQHIASLEVVNKLASPSALLEHHTDSMEVMSPA